MQQRHLQQRCMPVCRTSALPGQQALLELSWRTDNDILAGRNVASQIYDRIVLLYPDLAQHHDVNLYNSSPPQASQATVFSWSPIGCPLMLLTATGDGQICAWSPSGTVDTHWTPCVVLIAAKPIVKQTFLEALPLWTRRDRQPKPTEATAHTEGIDARFAASSSLGAGPDSQHSKPHWIRNSTLTAAVITSDGMIKVFWKVLSASGKFKWQTSQPIPVTASGTITAAQIAVSPNATCTIALQTLEQPDSLQIFAMEGNPTLPITAERALRAHCQPIGKVEAAEGQSVVQFLFQPQSAGCSLLVLLHAKPNTLILSRYEANAQQEQDSSNAAAQSKSWTVQASFQTQGRPFSGQEPAKSFHSDQLMASVDGTCVVLVTSAPGQEDYLQVHVLDPATLQLQAIWQLPGTCTAAAVSPNGCLLASAHQARLPGAAQPTQTSSPDSHTHTYGQSELQTAAAPASEDGHHDSSLGLPCTHVSFNMLLPEAQKVSTPKPGVSGQCVDDDKSTMEVEMVEVEDDKEGTNGLDILSKILVDRLCWSLTNHTSSWDVVQCIKALGSLQGGTWLAGLLSKADHAMHAQPHNRSYYAAALDQVKLTLLQDVSDASAQAVRQDIWMRCHVNALETVLSTYCTTPELSNKSFAPEKLHEEDQQVLRQWISKADDIITFMLHSIYRWLQQHELAVREGRAQGFQEDAVPCVRLLSDEHFVKRIAKALSVYVVVMRPASTIQSAQQHQQQQQLPGVLPQQAEKYARVKQLFNAFQSIQKVLTQARTAKPASSAEAPAAAAESSTSPMSLARDAQASFQGMYQLHYARPLGAVQWPILQAVTTQLPLPSFQGHTALRTPGKDLEAMADLLGLNHKLGPGQAQTAPWHQLHGLAPALPSLDDSEPALDVGAECLAGQMFNHSGREQQASRKRQRLQAERDAACAVEDADSKATFVDAISGKALSWLDTCSHACGAGCCVAAEMASPAELTAHASLYSKVLKRKWANACPLTGAAWQQVESGTIFVG